jgi:methyltransferase (TIGR00027 family)
MAARSRYAEDELARAVAHGVGQYVVLGAGLDTFAYRNPHPDLRVFEVDHPATQAWKREQLQAAQIAVPRVLNLRPHRLRAQTLADWPLRPSGFNAIRAGVFLLAGRDALSHPRNLHDTLSFIAKMPAGSGVVFDFAVDPALLNVGQRKALAALSKRVARGRRALSTVLRSGKIAGRTEEDGIPPHRTSARQGTQRALFQRPQDGLLVRGSLGHLMGAWV